ncbi:MAG: tetratricopeptide repeat protein [Anaerosomatales bacterium]|nr:tetratricopeptide repeat protein [Anaerosomatales bacterium]MDI6842810.1 tetratricopeptide repeat protein [Anaerosomatales bacterium]
MTPKKLSEDAEPVLKQDASLAVGEEAAGVEASEREGSEREPREEDLVPGWLALLVLLLLLAVTAAGGFVLRGVLTRGKQATPATVAEDAWKAALERDPEDLEARLNLAYSYQQQQRWDDALAQYEEVLKRDPQNLAAMYNRGMVLLAQGKSKDAEAALWEVLKVAPDHVLAAKTLGELYLSQKHYKSALFTVEPVLKSQPQYADLQYIAGYASEQLGKRDEAIAYYRAALKYAPDMAEAKDGLKRLGASQ